MTTLGLTDAGFVAPSATDIRSQYEAGFRTQFRKSLPLGDKTILGFLIGMVTASLAELWQIGAGSYSIMDADAVTGIALRMLSLLTGTIPLQPVASTVLETLVGDDGSVIPVGYLISTASTGQPFVTQQACTITDLVTWVATTHYSIGDRVSNGGNSYQCITDGISAGSGGPTTTDPDITDNTVHWMYLGPGLAAVDVEMACSITGAIVAVAGDLTDIATPIGGLNAALNLADAKAGRGVQSDQSLRLLRQAELAGGGTGPADSVRAALLELTNVISATVFFNDTDATVGTLTPHSTECLVRDGDDQDIWNALWANVPLGIRTIGTTVGTVVDSEGTVQTLRFSRPDEIPIYVDISVIVDASVFSSDGAVQIKTAIVTFGDAQNTGKDAVSSSIGSQAFSVLGVLDVTATLIGVAPSPSSPATIPISLRQLATFDSLNISVHVTSGTP